MVLQKKHELFGEHIEAWLPATFSLPGIVLTLIQEAPFRAGKKFNRRATIIAVVCLATSSQCDNRAVVEVVIPHTIETDTPIPPWMMLGNS